MSRTSKSKAKGRGEKDLAAGYYEQTHRPLHSLVFLLPLLLIYELGLGFLQAASPQAEASQLVAVRLLRTFLALFGAVGDHLPALAVIAILAVSHLASRQPWKVHWPTVLGMTGESVLLALPLKAIHDLLGYLPQVGTLGAATTQPHLWYDQLILSIGAGIYEELVFRLMLISILSMVLIDMLRLSKGFALAAIIVLSSAAFAMLHHAPLGSEPFEPTAFAFRMLAGGFLASVYVLRGFAVAVGTHAFYDVIAFTTQVVFARTMAGSPT